MKQDVVCISMVGRAGVEKWMQRDGGWADREIVVTTTEISAVRDADRIIGLLEK